jgi:hypothetical protein
LKSIAKILAFYFLLGSLFPNTDFGQLTKVMDFYQHFTQHQQENDDECLAFSLHSFLLEHYTNSSHLQKPNGHSHHNLPLHQVGHSVDFVFISWPSVKSIEITTNSQQHTLYKEAISCNFTQSVFQPPVG